MGGLSHEIDTYFENGNFTCIDYYVGFSQFAPSIVSTESRLSHFRLFKTLFPFSRMLICLKSIADSSENSQSVSPQVMIGMLQFKEMAACRKFS